MLFCCLWRRLRIIYVNRLMLFFGLCYLFLEFFAFLKIKIFSRLFLKQWILLSLSVDIGICQENYLERENMRTCFKICLVSEASEKKNCGSQRVSYARWEFWLNLSENMVLSEAKETKNWVFARKAKNCQRTSGSRSKKLWECFSKRIAVF
jgi:hypothetical protein